MIASESFFGDRMGHAVVKQMRSQKEAIYMACF